LFQSLFVLLNQNVDAAKQPKLLAGLTMASADFSNMSPRDIFTLAMDLPI
jgi:hypothetical protein